MTIHAKQSWAATRLPYLGSLCAIFYQKNRAPEAPYLAALPFLIAATAALLTVSGLVLAVYYNPWHAFDSVQFISRNVNNGWLVQAYHNTGTTLIFALVYLYLFRSLRTRAYRAPGEFVWLLSVKLLALLLLTGWLGFVLSGGAAGCWSLFRAANAALTLGGLPGAIGLWFFGGVAGNNSLARLLVFHLLLAAAAVLVLWILRASRKAAAPAVAPERAVAFFPYYAAQYFAALAVFAFIFAILAFYAPHLGVGALNAVPAASLAVPVSGDTPWYLAPAAGLAGAFSSPGLSLVAVIAALALLYAQPWLDRSGAQGAHGRLYGFFLWLLALDVLALGFAADAPLSAWSATLEGVLTAWYFLHFLVITPVLTTLEAE